ncbi:MAG: hypothetical protein IPK71_00845 [Myxococcales bacterium]|nr:hypothetical protein [Myxococcales bacterium]
MRPRQTLALLLTAWGALTLSRPAHAAILSVVQPEIASIVAVTAGEDTWVSVTAADPRVNNVVRVVPLPEGATDVRLAPQSVVWLVPKYFRVEQPPLCDPHWSCEAPRASIEPPDRPQPKWTPPKQPPKASSKEEPIPNTGCLCAGRPCGDLPPPPPTPPRPPRLLRVVARSAIESTVRELTATIDPHYYEGPDGGADIAARAPNVSRFAVVVGDANVAFRVRGPFVWPILPRDRGGPSETIMIVMAASTPTTPFPRTLLRAEPPRLYLAPLDANGHRNTDVDTLATILAGQLAAEGKTAHLERAMPIDPKAAGYTDMGARLGFPEVSLPKLAGAFRLFRYRFRDTPDLGFSPTTQAELPHPREIATAFVAVDSHRAEPGDPRCPGKFGACYKPLVHANGWLVESGFGPTRATVDPSKPAPRIVEAPYSLATPVMRDPSPFPALPASPASSAPAPPAPLQPTPPKAPAPGTMQPGPRGCACDTAAPPTTDAGAALVGIAFALIGAARRRHSERELR